MELGSPSSDRISSAARSERTAATNVMCPACSDAHRRMACPVALFAPVITILIERLELRSSIIHDVKQNDRPARRQL